MANVYPNYANAGAHGVPVFELMDTYLNQYLLANNEPGVQQPRRILLDDSLALPAFQVVGISGGKLVKATWNSTEASAIKPIGVLVRPATSGASNTTVYGEVFLEGSFNVDSQSPLVWDATYDTVAKKVGYNAADSRLMFAVRTSSAAI